MRAHPAKNDALLASLQRSPPGLGRVAGPESALGQRATGPRTCQRKQRAIAVRFLAPSVPGWSTLFSFGRPSPAPLRSGRATAGAGDRKESHIIFVLANRTTPPTEATCPEPSTQGR